MALGCLFIPSQRLEGFKVFKGLKGWTLKGGKRQAFKGLEGLEG